MVEKSKSCAGNNSTPVLMMPWVPPETFAVFLLQPVVPPVFLRSQPSSGFLLPRSLSRQQILASQNLRFTPLSSFPVLFLVLSTSPVGSLCLSGTLLAFFFSLHPQNFSRFSAVIRSLCFFLLPLKNLPLLGCGFFSSPSILSEKP